MFGGRGRNLWRKQYEPVFCSAAEGATHGASNGSQFYILGGRGRNLWRKQ